MKRNPEYAKRVEIANHDERNLFVAQKAYVFSFAAMVVIVAIIGVVFVIMGHKDYGMLCFFVVCIQTLLYACSYWYYQKKY